MRLRLLIGELLFHLCPNRGVSVLGLDRAFITGRGYLRVLVRLGVGVGGDSIFIIYDGQLENKTKKFFLLLLHVSHFNLTPPTQPPPNIMKKANKKYSRSRSENISFMHAYHVRVRLLLRFSIPGSRGRGGRSFCFRQSVLTRP